MFDPGCPTRPLSLGLHRFSRRDIFLARGATSASQSKGARAAGLREEYVARLAAVPPYPPSAETLALRCALPAPAALPPFTIAELRAESRRGKPCGVTIASAFVTQEETVSSARWASLFFM